ncbi:hypothetical protein HanIR_Chr14g0704851 [Helianthus annuus]|nr:hypothetical protein HanIR_Chr14g0704851 [Helianthus annuus]
MLYTFVRCPRWLQPQGDQGVGPSLLGGSRHTEAPNLPTVASCKGPFRQNIPCLLPSLCLQPSCLEPLLPNGRVLLT